MNTQPTRRRACGAALLALASWAGAAGCDGPTAAPDTTPEDTARKTLDSALEAWKKGETVDAVKKANPSIVVSDPRWKDGAQLTKYEVLGSGEPSGAERVFQVKLWLKGEGGKELQESVAYRVGTQPILTVFRSLF
jgi:hypothetical protein